MATKPKVSPRTVSPTHTLSLSDGVQEWGLILEGGVKGIQEQPMTPTTLLTNSQGGKFGDYDPSMSHLQQADWSGGRGNERFADDGSRYFDGKNVWTMTEQAFFPSLQWKHALGYRSQDVMPLADTYDWRPLIGSVYKQSVSFAASASYSTTKVYLWLKKIGNPGTLTVELRSGATNKPNAVLKTATSTGSTLEQNVIYNAALAWASAYSLVASTQYHIVAYGAATDNPANHWEIMTVYDAGATPYAYYFDSSANDWVAQNYKLYYRVTGADPSQRWLFFYYGTKQYAVSIPGSGNSQLFYMTSTASGFTSNSGNDQVMTEVATTGLTVVTDVCVSNGAVYFAQGSSVNIRRWNGTTFADDGTNKATFLLNYTDPTQGAVIWRSYGVAVSKAPVVAWGNDLVFGTAITIGEAGDWSAITGMTGYNDAVWVFKANSIWSVRLGRATKLDVGLDDVLSQVTGRAATAHGLYLYFGYATSLEQLYGSTLSDVGPHHGAGLPSDRAGYISALASVFSHLFVAVDGGTTRYSSIMVFDGINYHELWRAPEIGRRISTLFWQAGVNGTNPLLWFDYGGDILFIKFPFMGFNVMRDTGMYYAPGAELTTSTFDMNATRLPKIFKELTLITQNLQTSTNVTKRVRSSKITHNSRIGIDYQCDDDIGSSTWTYAGECYASPSQAVSINEGQRYAIRFRIRLQASDAANPPVVNAVVLEGIARTPIKYQWILRAKISSLQSTLNGAPDHNPDKILKWLQEKASRAEKLTLHSTFLTMDKKQVLAEPPSVMREYVDTVSRTWGGYVTIVLREA